MELSRLIRPKTGAVRSVPAFKQERRSDKTSDGEGERR